jgi:hypothetical protein
MMTSGAATRQTIAERHIDPAARITGHEMQKDPRRKPWRGSFCIWWS